MPTCRWVGGFKIVPAADLLRDKPGVPGQLYSDDTEATARVKQLFESVEYPIESTGPLTDGRVAEEKLWAWNLSKVSY